MCISSGDWHWFAGSAVYPFVGLDDVSSDHWLDVVYNCCSFFCRIFFSTLYDRWSAGCTLGVFLSGFSDWECCSPDVMTANEQRTSVDSTSDPSDTDLRRMLLGDRWDSCACSKLHFFLADGSEEAEANIANFKNFPSWKVEVLNLCHRSAGPASFHEPDENFSCWSW